MVDTELKSYIQSLLKEGYTLDSIKAILLKAGHSINKIEKISDQTYEEMYKKTLDLIDKKRKKEKKFTEIKEEFLEQGYSDEDINELINYYKRYKPLKKWYTIKDIISKKQNELKTFIKTHSYMFIAITSIILIIIITMIILQPKEPILYSTEELQEELCKNIDSEHYKSLCYSLIYTTPDLCLDIDDIDKQKSCSDLYNLYYSYIKSDIQPCKKIMDLSLRELCIQITEKKCNYHFDYGDECYSIIEDSLEHCLNQEKTISLFPECNDNYFIHKSISSDNKECEKINNIYLKELCEIIA
jgi:hypothetical protein